MIQVLDANPTITSLKLQHHINLLKTSSLNGK